MRRFSSVVCALSLAAVVLAACGGDTTPPSATVGSGVASVGITKGSSNGAATSASTPGSSTISATTAAAILSTTARLGGTVTTASANFSGGSPDPSTTAANSNTIAAKTASTGTPAASVSARAISPSGAVTASATGSTYAAFNLPVYPGLKVLSVGATFEQALAQSLTGQAGPNVQYGIYSTSEAPDKVVSFYDEALKKSGYGKQADQNIPTSPSGGFSLGGKVEAYSKGNGSDALGVVVSILGPVDATTISLLSTQVPNISSQIKPGDYMVLLINNVSGTLQMSNSPAATSPSAIATANPGRTTPGGTPTR